MSNIKKVFERAARSPEDKVQISFLVTPRLKKQFEGVCKANEVSVTKMLIALMEISIEDENEDTNSVL